MIILDSMQCGFMIGLMIMSIVDNNVPVVLLTIFFTLNKVIFYYKVYKHQNDPGFHSMITMFLIIFLMIYVVLIVVISYQKREVISLIVISAIGYLAEVSVFIWHVRKQRVNTITESV